MPPGLIKLRSGSVFESRKLLQPNHFCSLDELEQAILDFIAHSNRAAEPLKWSYTVEKLERKFGTNLR
jgi:hypothetical protein